MWQRSNDKFGQASKLKGEAGYWDLAMVRCQHEFGNTTVIGLIESKLPKSMRREWAKEIIKRESDVSGGKKFTESLEFLIELKKVVEYDKSDIRSHDDEIEVKGNQSCFLHNTNKHSMENRKTYQDKT